MAQYIAPIIFKGFYFQNIKNFTFFQTHDHDLIY